MPKILADTKAILGKHNHVARKQQAKDRSETACAARRAAWDAECKELVMGWMRLPDAERERAMMSAARWL
jgi:hypothetical protein